MVVAVQVKIIVVREFVEVQLPYGVIPSFPWIDVPEISFAVSAAPWLGSRLINAGNSRVWSTPASKRRKQRVMNIMQRRAALEAVRHLERCHIAICDKGQRYHSRIICVGFPHTLVQSSGKRRRESLETRLPYYMTDLF